MRRIGGGGVHAKDTPNKSAPLNNFENVFVNLEVTYLNPRSKNIKKYLPQMILLKTRIIFCFPHE